MVIFLLIDIKLNQPNNNPKRWIECHFFFVFVSHSLVSIRSFYFGLLSFVFVRFCVGSAIRDDDLAHFANERIRRVKLNWEK